LKQDTKEADSLFTLTPSKVAHRQDQGNEPLKLV